MRCVNTAQFRMSKDDLENPNMEARPQPRAQGKVALPETQGRRGAVLLLYGLMVSLMWLPRRLYIAKARIHPARAVARDGSSYDESEGLGNDTFATVE